MGVSFPLTQLTQNPGIPAAQAAALPRSSIGTLKYRDFCSDMDGIDMIYIYDGWDTLRLWHIHGIPMDGTLDRYGWDTLWFTVNGTSRGYEW